MFFTTEAPRTPRKCGPELGALHVFVVQNPVRRFPTQLRDTFGPWDNFTIGICPTLNARRKTIYKKAEWDGTRR
jgi:hypothetical protein